MSYFSFDPMPEKSFVLNISAVSCLIPHKAISDKDVRDKIMQIAKT